MFKYYVLLLSLLFAACSEHSGSTADRNSDEPSEHNELPAGNFYKRYSGNIAGKPVTVHLHRYGNSVQGSYYYNAVGRDIALRDWNDSAKAGDVFYFRELPPVESLPEDASGDAIWSLRIAGDHATGEWRSADSTKQAPIDLIEEYPEGTVRLDAHRIADSSALLPNDPASPKATAGYSYLMPAEGAGSFVYSELLQQLIPGGNGANDVETRLKAAMAAYFADYRKENESLSKEANVHENAFAFSFTNDEAIYVRYNDKGWLVTESFSTSYTGGAHGNYGSSFANIDFAGKRIWQVNDIITDTTQLRPMLNDAAILYFKLKPGEGMEERMLVDEVPPTGNIHIGPAGVSFVYNPYEIASYADGQVTIYLPYRKLMPYLTSAFKQRMALTERAGIAMHARHTFKRRQPL